MKTIWIDGSKLIADVASGISNYIAHLFKELGTARQPTDPNFKIHLYDAIPTHNIYVKEMGLNGPNTVVQSKAAFRWSTLTGSGISCDLYHSPYMFIPPASNHRDNLLTVHDMINLERPLNLRNKA